MANSITIRLNDEVTDGVEEIQSALAEMGHFSSETARGIRDLSAAEQEQIQVIHEHRGSLVDLTGDTVQFAGESVSAIGAVTAAYIHFKAETAWLTYFKSTLASVGTATAAWGNHLDLAARQGIGLLRFVPRFGATVGNVIPVLTGATLATAGFEAVLSRTGRRMVDTTHDLSQATDEQRRAFEALATEAQRSGTTIDEALLRAGQSFADFGVQVVPVYESNLDRVDAATAKLLTSLARPFRTIADGAAEVLSGLNPLAPVLREIDAAATRSTDNLVRNIAALQSLSEAAADATLGEGYSQHAAELQRLEELRARQADDFARLRGVNQQLDAEQTAAAERRRLDGIQTIAGIDAEIQRQRQRANELANSDQLTAAAAEELHATLARLEQQRTQILERETQTRLDLERRVTEQQQRWADEARQREEQAVTDFIDRENAKYDAAQKAAAKRAELERGLVHTAESEAFQNAVARMQAQGASAEDLHQAKLRQIDLETRQRLESADTEDAREQILFDAQRERLQAEGNFHRQQMQQQARDRQQKAQAEAAAEQAKHDQIKALLQQSGGPTGHDLLTQQDPRQVLAALQARRAQAAAEKFRAEHGDEVNDGDSRSRARFAARERAVRQQAERDAFQDFRRGDVNPQELANAQVQAGQQTLSTLQQSGQLSQDVVKVLSQQLQAAAQEQQVLSQLQQQVANLQKASDQLAGGSKRISAQQGSLRR